MHFWGICCDGGKRYAQTGGQKFRVTMAVLDPTSVHKGGSHEMISVMVNRNGTDYLLCVLKHREIQQVNLNLIFDKKENVEFYCNRNGKVHLSGYWLNDSECDVLNDDEYLCPLVEIKSDSENSSRDVSPVVTKFKTSTAKRSKKSTADSFNLSDVSSEKVPRARELWHSFLNDFSGGEDDIDDDDDDDNSDKDFSVDDEEYSSDSDDDEEEEEVEVTDDDIEEVTLNGESSEEKTEIIQNLQESRKRKKKVEVIPQKRCKNANFKVTSESHLENSVDDICLEGTESYDKDASSQVNSDACSTPVPEKKVINETVSSKKKSRKKKRKSEVSNISNNELQTKFSDAASTSKSSYPIVKLNGGVEIQEIMVGRGPEAKIGKVLHVFYVGRLPNKSIFDSRLPAKKPFSFKLGTNQVIKGWDIGFEGMKAGGKRKIKVPPDMAYGKAGNDGIPPNTTLYFVVELTSVS